MEKTLNNIISSLQSEIDNPTNIQDYNRQHIFDDIKSMIRNKLMPSDVMDLNYHFYIYEKCLEFSREKAFGLAEYWIHHINESYIDLEGYVKKPLRLLYLPMIAFYHYAKKDYLKALNYLLEERVCIDSFFESHDELSIEFNLEQVVNIFRVYYSMNDLSSTLKYSRAILLFSTLGTSQEGIVEGDMQVLKENDPQNAINWIRYITNSVLAKPLYDNTNIELKRNTLEGIFEPFFGITDWNACPIPTYKHAMVSLKAFKNEDIEKQILEVAKLIDSITTLPENLQFYLFRILLVTINKEFPKYQPIFIKTANEYLKGNLKLKLSLSKSSVTMPV